MKINCYYCNYKNFGDQLNQYIFQKELGYGIDWAVYERATLMGIGSIIEAILIKPNDKRKKTSESIFCFSSGFAQEDQLISIVNKEIQPSLLRPVEYLAIRGEKTKKLLIDHKLMSEDAEPVLADAGLLASDLLDEPGCKKYEVGIVAHAQESHDPVFKELQLKIPNSILLNIQEDTLTFLKKISQCETIISTAMHPLIAADSLGIPNLWMRLPEKNTATNSFKFDDYYSAFGLSKKPVDIYSIDAAIKQEITKAYDIPAYMVKEKKNELRNALSIFKIYIDQEQKQLNKKYLLNLLFMCFSFYPRKILIEYPVRLVRKLKNIFMPV